MEQNVGIIGCGQILYQAIIVPSLLNKTSKAYGITSRNFEKAKAFAVQCKIPHVFENVDDLLACEEIDFIYIALPNYLHHEMIIKAAEHKKHILVEKPICLSCHEFTALNVACEKNGVHLLEGLMVQHHPWQSYLKQYIASGKLGALKKVDTRISFIPNYNLQENYRSHPEFGGGCFFDLGSYWVQFIQYLIGLEANSLEGRSDFSGINHCDFTFSAKMQFLNKIETTFLASFEMPFQASHEVIFEKGCIKIPNFFAANMGKHKIQLQIENKDIGTTEAIEFLPQNYFMNQLNFFLNVMEGAATNVDINDSGERVRVMEAIYQDARQREKIS